MEISKLKTGNTYKFKIRRRIASDVEVIEQIFTYKNKDEERLYFMDREGSKRSSFIRDIVDITSTRIDSQEREALKDLALAQIKEEKIENDYKTLIREARTKSFECVRKLKEISPLMSRRDFGDTLATYIEETFNIPVRCIGWGGDFILLCHEKDIERWAMPEQYSFIRRRYDNTTYIEDEDINYKRTLKSYSLNAILPLKKVSSKIEEYLSLGDKNWLSVCKTYKIPVKEFTKVELENLKKKIS